MLVPLLCRYGGRGTGDEEVKKEDFTMKKGDIFRVLVLICMGNYKELEVWKESRALAVDIYNITSSESFDRDHSLKNQIRRAAISIPSNIAEGDESGFDKLGTRFFFIAKASLAEVETQLDIANAIGYLNNDSFNELSSKITRISKRLRRLIQYRQSKI